MPAIVAVAAGDKENLLLDLWRGEGNHETSTSPADLPHAQVVLFGDADLDALAPLDTAPAGLTLIDCGNPADAQAFGDSSSRAESIARRCPRARVVKAFNTITLEALEALSKFRTRRTMATLSSAFYCGDQTEAKQLVAGLASELYLDPVDCGGLVNARLLESLGLLGGYLQANIYATTPFTISIVRRNDDGSPLDRWM